ncbi:MAG: L-glutamate gamma-semialdehyde dehydrogenase [Deltaproteobacteria bacterium]
MSRNQDLEQAVQKTGREIYSLIGEEIPTLMNRMRWKGKIMESAMKDDTFKTQLFRFVDVLPSLRTDAVVVSVLNEYLADVESAPRIVRQGLKRISREGFIPNLAGRAIRAGVESFARHFIAGRDPMDSFTALEALDSDGVAMSIDLLGEEVLSDREAQIYTERYLDLLTFLPPQVKNWRPNPILDLDSKGLIPRLDISLKPTSFYSQMNPVNWEGSIQHTTEGLRPVVQKAKEQGVSLTIDMEYYYLKDLTIEIFKALLDEHVDFAFGGLALQAYLRDTKEDLLALIEWAKARQRRITIRLVKGAYWDYEGVVNRQKGWPVPVISDKVETDHSFEELTALLLENIEHVRPAFATHNIRSLSHAIAVADTMDLPRDAFEFQTIYGMAEPVRTALQRMGFRVRAYTPVGELIPGMAYLIRRLLENTSNESFLRKSFLEETPFSVLIRAPHPSSQPPAEENEDHAFANEPAIDFSKAENRQAMKEALARVREEFNSRYPIVIRDEEAWTENDAPSVNPARPDEVVGRVASAAGTHAASAVAAAREAWTAWRRTTPEERSRFLFNAAEELRKARFELMALEVYEVGKTWRDADGDVTEAIDYLEYYGREMIRLGAPRLLGSYPGEENIYRYGPKGVGVVISPWNFPLAIPTGMVSAGIVTGNCVIFKPSGLSPVLGWKLFEVFRRVGLPAGVLQFLPGPGHEVGEYLVSHPDIDFIAFTGSREVGLRIVQLAGETRPGQRNVKRVIAEMGGKNAIIVDETANLDETVKGIVESAFGFQGQKCSACSRVIAVGAVFDQLCGRLKDATESVEIAPPEEPRCVMGPVVDEAALSKIRRYREIGRRDGNTEFVREAQGEGYFIGPAVFLDVNADSPLAQEEIFGPVVAVMRAPDLDTAIDIANGTPYALTGGVFSRRPKHIRRVKSELAVGNVYINRGITGALVGRQPFGGFGMSGVGSKAGGPDYLLQFMNIRSISENTLRRGFAPDANRE